MGDNDLSQRKLTSSEVKFLEEALSADPKIGNIRLREGEYQYILAKAVASFQLELYFPNVKDVVKRLYGEEKTNDIRFIRKIQTILKKLEKSNVVKILPKKKPWELQRYALSGFKFQDSYKNLVMFATDEQMKQSEDLLRSVLSQEKEPKIKLDKTMVKIGTLTFVATASYAAILWDLMQATINPILFVVSFSVAVVSSLMLGRMLS